MPPGTKIEHHHMKAMLYKILQAKSQCQNKLMLPQARMKFEQNSYVTNEVRI